MKTKSTIIITCVLLSLLLSPFQPANAKPLSDPYTSTYSYSPSPSAAVYFVADQYMLTAGQCTFLRWDVDNVQAVFLNEQGTGGHGVRQVCPRETVIYTLRVVTSSTTVIKAVTIEVSGSGGAPPSGGISFVADVYTIQRGQCANLRWDAEDIREIYFEGQGTVGHDSRQVCPQNTTTYTLRAVTNNGNVERQVTITVITQRPTATFTPYILYPTWTPTALPTLTPTFTPTATIETSPRLVVEQFEIQPSEPAQFEVSKLLLSIVNEGYPLNDPFWGYVGQVNLLGADSQPEVHNFAKGDASYINPTLENNLISTRKWLIKINVRFSRPVDNGKLQIIIQPNNRSFPKITAERNITVKASGGVAASCLAVVVSKLGGPFVPDVGKAPFDAIVAEVQALGCKDQDFACQAPPLVKALIKILIRIGSMSVGKIITGIWGVLDIDALKVCSDPFGWIWQLIREFNQHGIKIAAYSVHSPATILVTDSSGRRTGYVSEDLMIAEIPDSRIAEWEGSKYIIHPAIDANIVLQGAGDGKMTFDVIHWLSSEFQEMSFVNIPLSVETKAKMDFSKITLEVDSNGDGVVDQSQSPDKISITKVSAPPINATPTIAPTVVATSNSYVGAVTVALLTGLGVFMFGASVMGIWWMIAKQKSRI
jgi:hypothetical protein